MRRKPYIPGPSARRCSRCLCNRTGHNRTLLFRSRHRERRGKEPEDCRRAFGRGLLRKVWKAPRPTRICRTYIRPLPTLAHTAGQRTAGRCVPPDKEDRRWKRYREEQHCQWRRAPIAPHPLRSICRLRAAAQYRKCRRSTLALQYVLRPVGWRLPAVPLYGRRCCRR